MANENIDAYWDGIEAETPQAGDHELAEEIQTFSLLECPQVISRHQRAKLTNKGLSDERLVAKLSPARWEELAQLHIPAATAVSRTVEFQQAA